MKALFVSASVIVVLFLFVTSSVEAQERTSNRLNPPTKQPLKQREALQPIVSNSPTAQDSAKPKEEKDWHLSWDRFLKIYQDCLNDQSCNLKQFDEQTVTWEGAFRGISKDREGRAIIEMTSASMTDRRGKTMKVENNLVLTPSNPKIWSRLAGGEKVRFRGTIMGGLGTGFYPIRSDCCFMLIFNGKGELVENSTTQKK